ncbi:FAD-dependent monooxygenase [Trebonia sp.]|uniref:FAD-dependent monooxygenase n=2 Tax=Trebonia sp. TaxID=2767075 RepID=UPI002635A951|nr:FAD-dependent monooxygenase [Trebonia sp.]
MTVEHLGVVVVGAGPAGYAAALGLAELGVACTLVEQHMTVAAGSRATGISRRTLQLLARSGISDEVMRIAIPQRGNQAFYRTAELFLDRSPDEPGKYPRVVNLKQDLFEEMIAAAVRAQPLIDLRWGHRVDGVGLQPDGVSLSVTAEDRELAVKADWLIACDGSRSHVRRELGLALQGVRYQTRFIVTDVRARLDLEPGIRRIWFDPPSNPQGTVIMHQQPHDLWRIDFGVPVDEQVDVALSPDAIRGRVDAQLRMLGLRSGWEIVWSGDYTASGASLKSYRHGRVFFAGDAAHLVPIFGGRGLNSAVEDGFNLAWKLASVIRGGAGEALLDTYSLERAEGTRQNLAKAGIGAEVIAAYSPGARLLRHAALSLMADREPRLKSLLNHRTSDASVYPRSLLDMGVPPGGESHPAEHVAGDALVRFGDGRTGYLTDELGAGFTVLEVDEPAVPPAEPVAADPPQGPAELLGLPLRRLRVSLVHEQSGVGEPGLSRGRYLLRPDRYVLAHRDGEGIDDVLTAVAALARAPAIAGETAT